MISRERMKEASAAPEQPKTQGGDTMFPALCFAKFMQSGYFSRVFVLLLSGTQ